MDANMADPSPPPAAPAAPVHARAESQLELTRVVQFGGAALAGTDREHVSAPEFLAEAHRRRSRNNWDDAQTMAWVTACLSHGARSWFLSADTWRNEEEALALSTSFEVFERCFCRQFNCAPDADRKDFGIRDIGPQKPNEDMSTFIGRVATCFSRTPSLPSADRASANHNLGLGIDAFPAEWRERVAAYGRQHYNIGRQRGRIERQQIFTQLVVRDNVCDRALQAKARELYDKKVDMPTFVEELVRAEANRKAVAAGKPLGRRQINAIDEAADDDGDDGNDDEEVAAAALSRGKGRKPKGKPKPKNPNPHSSTSKPQGAPRHSKECSFCKKKGHTADRCFARKYCEDNNVQTVSAVQPSRENPQWPGNGNGLWM